MTDQSTARRPIDPLVLVLILSGAFFTVFLIVSAFLFMGKFSNSSSQKPGRAIFHNESIAVIELNGVIMDSKKILKRLEKAEEDAEIKAVVLRLNSPGGAVAPSQEIYERVRKFKKPLVASMSSVAASGAFYIACGAKEVFANAGTITGSIGVIMEFANLEKLYEWAKIKRFSIKTGKFKDAGSEYREMTPEDRALLQGMVDDVLVQFKQAVSTGRKLPMDKVDGIADGRVLSGNQALAAKLVDRLGTIDDAIAAASKLAGITGKPHLVYPDESKHKLLDLILEHSSGDSDSDSEGSTTGLWPLVSTLIRELSGRAPVALEQGGGTGMHPGIYWLWNGSR